MKSSVTSILSVLFALIATCSVALSQERIPGVYDASAVLTLEWKLENRAELLTTEEVYKVEEGSSQYFQELLMDPTHNAVSESTDILSTRVNAVRQQKSNDFVILESEIVVSHIGTRGLSDLASVFMFLVGRNISSSVYTTLDSLIDIPEMRLDMVSFTNVEDSKLLMELNDTPFQKKKSKRYSKTERSLIITTTVLSLTVVALSAILIWIAGGWLALRKQVKILIHREEELTRMTKGADQNIRQGPTASESDEEAPEDDEDKTRFTSSSGILGVNPYYGKPKSALDGLGIKMTPARSERNYDDMDSEVQTPMSAMTSYSDTDRAPIGIMSMRKLVPGASASEEDPNSLGKFAGVKRLDF